MCIDIFHIYMKPARLNTPLKQALAEDGRRQNWLAERLGVDARQVWGWVHGVHIPGHETKAEIARILGRTPEELWPAHDDLAAAA
jgi:transcriptional regulator with XRE-family HTH domain